MDSPEPVSDRPTVNCSASPSAGRQPGHAIHSGGHERTTGATTSGDEVNASSRASRGVQSVPEPAPGWLQTVSEGLLQTPSVSKACSAA